MNKIIIWLFVIAVTYDVALPAVQIMAADQQVEMSVLAGCTTDSECEGVE